MFSDAATASNGDGDGGNERRDQEQEERSGNINTHIAAQAAAVMTSAMAVRAVQVGTRGLAERGGKEGLRANSRSALTGYETTPPRG
jgi:hypothetical protein